MFRISPRAVPILATCLLAAAAASSSAAEPAVGCTPVDAVVTVAWQRDRAESVSGVVTRVRFPGSLDVPTDPSDASAKARVELLTTTSGGLFDALVRDSDGDRTGDLLNVGLITGGIQPGPFARIRFDCRPGASAASAGDFSCVADVADTAGSVPATCTVVVQQR